MIVVKKVKFIFFKGGKHVRNDDDVTPISEKPFLNNNRPVECVVPENEIKTRNGWTM